MSEKPRPIGYVKVQIYAGLPGKKPEPVGQVEIPLYADTLDGAKPFHHLLQEATDYTGQSIARIFREEGEKSDDGN